MIKAGFIGTGGIAGAHLQYLKSRKDVKITALCDISKKNLKKRQQEFGGKGFIDFRKMLDSARLDAVWLCTPPQVRRGPLLACVKKRLPVFCEKPVERSEEQGREIAGELAMCKGQVQVGYVFRSLPVVQRLRKEMKGDKIHLVQSLYVCNVSLTRALPAWFYDKERSGGALIDQATHSLDLLRYLFGEVKEVHGTANNPVEKKKPGYTVDEAIALSFVFARGAVGSHTHSWVGDNWRTEMVLSGEKRFYCLDLIKSELIVQDGAETRRFQQGTASIYNYQNDIFIEQVVSGDWRRNPSDYADGLRTLQLTLACDRAISDGKGQKIVPWKYEKINV